MSEEPQATIIVPDDLPRSELLDWFRGLPTFRLKQMWDDEIYQAYCDEIHLIMNERGYGSYVAV